MRNWVPGWKEIRERSAAWLLEGISPRRLALSLSLGFVLGCIPVVGIPTGLCVLVALLFRLNHPAIQAANYAAMPLQVALIAPLVKLGEWLTPRLARPGLELSVLTHAPLTTAMHAPAQLLAQLGVMAGQALLAWVVLAAPAAVALTLTLTGVLRRVVRDGGAGIRE